MSPEKQRIAMAIILDYTNVNPKCWRAHKDGVEVTVPTWDSLDAMHEAESILGPLGLDGSYEFWLREVCHFPEREAPKGRYFYRAKAPQRREAFLRTFNRWEE